MCGIFPALGGRSASASAAGVRTPVRVLPPAPGLQAVRNNVPCFPRGSVHTQVNRPLASDLGGASVLDSTWAPR